MISDGNISFPLSPGTLLDGCYKITRRIGSGAAGSVYLAEDLNLANRPVAVKEIIKLFTDESEREKATEDFKREAELFARLDHPSIPTIYRYFFDGERDRYYLVMKYIDGGDLGARQRLSGGKVDELNVTKWAIDICDALDYLHSQEPPIIYRDLKPASLMIDARTNRVMLVNFGIERFISTTQKSVQAIGSFGYSSPELFAGSVDARSNIYSLGATMFHLLTGHNPEDNPLLIFDFTKNPKPRQLNPEITPDMEEMICKAVERKPENRFASALVFGRELQTHLRNLKGRSSSFRIKREARMTGELINKPVNNRYCPSCQYPARLEALFCSNCGTRLEMAESTSRAASEQTSSGRNIDIQLVPGTLLVDRYKITRRIGGGAAGSVYLAEDLNLANRPVAVKEMIADESGVEKAIKDFKREAELLARLDHPSVPTIYQYFFDGERDRYYLVMKYIDGGDLAIRQRLSGGKVDELTVTKWAIDICDVLDYIHSQDPPIISRDVKPTNLMIDARTNRVMLVDFGIARFVPNPQIRLDAIGTMGYAPPELYVGIVEQRTDIYSLGATMFHLLTGHDPTDNPLLIFDFTKNPKPRQLNPEITPDMEEMICKAVERKPEDRFASAREFGQRLIEHLHNLQERPSAFKTHTEAQLKEIWPRLSRNARRALLWAEELRRTTQSSELYSEFLLSSFLLGDTFGRDLMTMFYDLAHVTLMLEEEVYRITGSSVSFAQVQAPQDTSDLVFVTVLSPNVDRILRRSTAISQSIHTRHLVASILDVPESRAAQWITRLTGVDQQQLFTLITTSPFELPSLDQVYAVSKEREHYQLPYNSIPRAVIFENAGVNIPLRDALREALIIPLLGKHPEIHPAVIIFHYNDYEEDWHEYLQPQVPTLIIIDTSTTIPLGGVDDPTVTFLISPSTEKLRNFFETKVRYVSEITPQPVPESPTVAYEISIVAPQEPIPIGGEIEIGVTLRPADAKNVTGFLLEVPRADAGANELNVLLHAPHFIFEGDNAASLPFDTEFMRATAQTARFRLTALRAGEVTVKAELYCGAVYARTIQEQVEICGVNVMHAPLAAAARSRPVAQPDLVLQISTEWDEAEAYRFHYSLASFRPPLAPAPENEYVSELLDAAWADRMRGLLGATLREIEGAEPDEARLRLASLGEFLWQKLWPDDLRYAFDRWAKPGGTLLVVADDDAWPPWELLHNGRYFLCERLIIGRWPRELDEARPYEFPVGEINIAYYENVPRPEAWRELLAAAGTPSPRLLPGGVLSELELAETMRGLHIVRFGQPPGEQDRQDAPVMIDRNNVADGPEAELRPARLSLRRYRPLVSLSYLNAGRPELTMLEQTWAKTFVRARSSGFVGTLWSVRPAVDAAFTAAFYQRLWAGDALGRAFQAGRRLARVVAPESMDWLAYTLFGDPLARPYHPVEGQGYAVVEPIGREMESPLRPDTPARFRISLRRTPPVWHEERVIEVAENLAFDNLQARVIAFGLKVNPATTITLKRTSTGEYLGWFTVSAPTEAAGEEALVQVYFADGQKPIHSLHFSIRIAD